MSAQPAIRTHTSPPEPAGPSLAAYVELLRCLERAHRQMVETVSDELERHRIGDVNAVQALLLFHLGSESLSAAEIKTTGRYLGSNVTYNLKKLTECGRMQEVRVRGTPRFAATESGKQVSDLVRGLFERQTSAVHPVCGVDGTSIDKAGTVLRSLERYWTDQVRFRL